MSRVLPVLVMFALAACQTAPKSTFVPHESQIAQVHWQTRETSLTSDVIFQKGTDDAIRLVVNKGQTILSLLCVNGRWYATGPLSGIGWSGGRDSAPRPLTGWISLAESWQIASRLEQKDRSVQTGRFAANYTFRNDDLFAIEVVSKDSGDRLRARF